MLLNWESFYGSVEIFAHVNKFVAIVNINNQQNTCSLLFHYNIIPNVNVIIYTYTEGVVYKTTYLDNFLLI